MVNVKDDQGRVVYQTKETRTVDNIWRIRCLQPANAGEWVNFATHKPIDLMERAISLASAEDDLVLDAFAGSGSTLLAAERLNRRWIACDLSRWSVHTTRKRLLDIPGCKPFEVLNLGKYERQYWQGVTTGRDDSAYMRLILQLYRAEPLEEATMIHGLKAGIAMHVGLIDFVVTIDEANAAAEAARELGYKRLHVLGWDWQMGLKETAVDHALALGVQLALKRIPSEIMDARAREKGDVGFFEMNHVDATAEVRNRSPGPSGRLHHRRPGAGEARHPGAHRTVLRLHRLLGSGFRLPRRHFPQSVAVVPNRRVNGAGAVGHA